MNWWTGRSQTHQSVVSTCAPTDVGLTPTITAWESVLVAESFPDTRRRTVELFTLYERIRPADRAWAALVFGVLAYEVMAKDGEMMSHSYDRWLQRRPVITWGATLLTVSHLLNLLPERLDPFTWGWKITRGA